MATHTSANGTSASLTFNFEGVGADPSTIVTPEDTPIPDTSVPGSTETIIPSTDTSTPDTGIFTGSSSLDSAPLLITLFTLIAVSAIAILIWRSRPHARYSGFSLSRPGLHFHDLRTSLKNLGIFTSVFIGLFLAIAALAPNLAGKSESTSALDAGYLAITHSSDTLSGTDNFDTNADATIMISDVLTVSAGSSAYSIYVSTNDDSSVGNYLTLGSSASNIAPVSGTTSAPSALDINTWGFTAVSPSTSISTLSPSSKVWSAVPIYAGESSLGAKVPATAISSGRVKLVFAARGAKTSTAAGSYRASLIYTAIAGS